MYTEYINGMFCVNKNETLLIIILEVIINSIFSKCLMKLHDEVWPFFRRKALLNLRRARAALI